MSRPLVVTDCDEVLLHMVRHFRDWLGEEHAIDFTMENGDFSTALRRRDDGTILTKDEIWGYLGGFFDARMNSQQAIAGAIESINTLAEHADVVVLTNLTDEWQERRRQQLAAHGLEARVFTNQGPKGPALKRIVEEFAPSRAVFIDDLAQHHHSARVALPEIATLHFCGEPALAPHIPCAHQAGHADARIDTWAEALPWLLETLHGK